ncbi:hypothetical protein ACWDUM_25670 [Rhodococcus sp. NPDC003322]
MTTPDETPLDVARGDRAVSAHLASSLKLLAAKSRDADFSAATAEVVAGRRSLRDLAASPVFDQVLGPLVRSFAEQYRQFDESDREALADEGGRRLDELGRTLDRRRDAATFDDDGDRPIRGILSSDW